MKKSSKVPLNQKIDYFELLDRSTNQSKIKSLSRKKQMQDVVKQLPDTPEVIARRAEIEAIKHEIYLLVNTDVISKIDLIEEHMIQERRAELIFCKKVLETEVA